MLMCVRLIIFGLILITVESVNSLDNSDFESSNKEDDQDLVPGNKPDILTHAEIKEKIGYVMGVIAEARALMDILKNQIAPIMTNQPTHMLSKEVTPDSGSVDYLPEDSEANDLSPGYDSLTEKPLIITTLQPDRPRNNDDFMTKQSSNNDLPQFTTEITPESESIEDPLEDEETNDLLPDYDALTSLPPQTTSDHSAHSPNEDYQSEELLPSLKSANTENNMARINVPKTSDPQKRYDGRLRRLQSILDRGKAYLEKLILEKELKEQEDSLQTDSHIDNSMPSSENNLNRRNIAQKKRELNMTIRRLSNLYNTLP
ncbi:unnamed protein product [Diamesa hyperborea]